MHTRQRQPVFPALHRGSAALEVLLLFPFIVLMFMLIFNMGYNAERHRKTQAAARIAAYSYVLNLARMNAGQAKTAAQNHANTYIFPNEGGSTAEIVIDPDTNAPQDLQGFNNDQGLLGSASNRITLNIATTRSAPYKNLFPDSRLRGTLTFSANTWTYCEMKDSDFGKGLQVMGQFSKVIGDYALWLFGGCGGGLAKGCPDECP